MVKLKGIKLKPNGVWLWWYCCIVLAVHSYLLYRAVQNCQTYNSLPWKTDRKPVAELYTYIAMLVISVMHIPFFIISSIFKVNNFANDSIKLGRDNVYKNKIAVVKEKRNHLMSVWQHLGPVCHFLHLSSAFCLLFPLVLAEGQEIRHGFLPQHAIWWSDVDVIFGKHRHIFDNTTTVPRKVSVSDNTTLGVIPPVNDVRYFGVVSPEFINYTLAFIIYALRYAGVFWRTHRGFCFILSIQLITVMLHSVISFCCFGILYKFQLNNDLNSWITLVLPSSATVVLYVISTIFMLFTSVTVFNYGYGHYTETYNKLMRKYHPQYAKPVTPPTGCEGYVPHTVATLLLVVIVGIKAAIVYDTITLFRTNYDPVLITGTVLDVFFLIAWSLLWFFFTVKQSWKFKISPMTPISIGDCYIQTVSNGHVAPENSDRSHMSMSTSERPILKPVEIKIPTDDQILHSRLDSVSTPTASPNGSDSRAATASGVLRKGSESSKKSTSSAQRVTFDKTIPDDSSGDITLDKDVVKKRKKKRSSSWNDQERKRSSYPGVLRSVSEDSPVSSADPPYKNRPKSMGFFGDIPLQVTPENTLTRNYRSSLRSGCNQYYTHEDDLPSPNLVREPLRHSTSRLPSSSRDNLNSAESYELSNYSDAIPQVPFRRDDVPNGPPKYHPKENTRDSTSPDRRKPSTKNTYMLPSGRSYVDTLQLNRKVRMDPNAGHAELNREIKMIDKPTLGRRDSALPSSNETSSNDSGDGNVLCSQV